MFLEKNKEEDSSLPRATVDKIIQGVNKNYMAKDARECLRMFSKQFLLLLASNANKHCIEEKKKTISIDHVYKAIELFKMNNFYDSVNTAVENYNIYTKHKPSKQDKFKKSGLTMEQLHEEQQKLFAAAKQQQSEVSNIDDMEIIIDDVQEIEE
ncbi:DR1 [Ecytonucleospora hepatopenaei]|uniref:DR1 n=1 Tax=Ecytonucleospora hepatopenaei TaxID=646526 RepID=A0A1W0E751_9MICR|nr:DR1 [Ecytonucleospora hepatopenaei]